MAHGDDSEAWRGEEAPEQRRPRRPSYLEAMFGGLGLPLTPAEMAQHVAWIAEQRATAAVRALLLPAYRPDVACPKCGGAKVRASYCAGGTSDSHVTSLCYADTAGQEHLHRTCKACHFTWYEKTLDATGVP